jgi:Flp pilus assembly protein TadD
MSVITRKLTGLFAVVLLCLSGSIALANLGDSDDPATDDPGFAEGKAAIEAQDWTTAIAALSKTAEAYPDSADTQNFLAYAYRKSGNLEAALEHYQRALEIDPSHKHAHEYLGEAYLMKDDLASAQKQLEALAKICTPIPCEEYKQLERAIQAYKNK